MKVYVVNLDKDVEKLASITSQLNRLGVAFERVPAVYGKAIAWNELKKNYNPFRWWCAVGRPIAPAEIGCALSHYGVYESISEPVCILEDDVILDAAFVERLSEVEKFIDPKKPQVVMLSDHTRRYTSGEIGIVSSNGAMCTDGYVITPLAAKRLLKANLPMIVPCDHWWRWRKLGIVELYHALPSVVRQDQATFGSSTSVAHRSHRASLWLWKKFLRLIGKMIDMVLISVIGH